MKSLHAFDPGANSVIDSEDGTKNRSHFISLLFECKIVTGPKKNLKYIKGLPKVGQWKWHDKCPKNLIKPHSNYRKFV